MPQKVGGSPGSSRFCRADSARSRKFGVVARAISAGRGYAGAVQKIVVHRAGSYERLVLEEHPSPEPGPNDVLVDVHAIGVNYADCIVRMGLYSSARKYVGWPITPGFELSGRVRKLGSAVAGLSIGDPVYGVTRFGAYASEVCVPSHQLFPLPPNVDHARAAGFWAVFLTAYYALEELCRLRPGMKVLVHSAAGGVGGALTQIAKLREAYVVGVVGSAHKRGAARSHGADLVIDKGTEELWAAAERAAPGGYDVVLDANGVETLSESFRHLAPAGRLVIYGFHTMMPKTGGKPNWGKLAFDWMRTPRFNPLDLTEQNKSVMAFNLSYLFDSRVVLEEGTRVLSEWLAAGKLSPHAVETFSLRDVARAHERIESGQSVGKLVLLTGREGGS